MPESTSQRNQLQEEKSNFIFPFEPTQVNILGTVWTVSYETPETDSELQPNDGGYTQNLTKRICILKYENENIDAIKRFVGQTLRHEIIHAFLFESGLADNSFLIEDSAWAMNEEMVDWFALQAPKIINVFNELNIAN